MRFVCSGLLAAIVLSCAAGPARASARAVSAVVASSDDEVVLQHLQALIDRPLVRRDAPADDLPRLLEQAVRWPERHVLVVDRKGGALHVVDAREGTVVTRLLVDETVRGSAYAVAFIAAELLGLSDQWVEVRSTARDGGGDGQPEHAPDDATAAPRLALGLAAEWTRYPASGVALLRPALEAWLQLGAGRARLAPWIGVRAAFFGDWSGGAGPQRMELSQHDLEARVGLGYAVGDMTLLFALGAGAQLVEAHLERDPPRDHSVLARLGAGLQARFRIAESLGLFAGLDGGWTPVATRYALDGEQVVAPARLGLAASVGLSWDDPL